MHSLVELPGKSRILLGRGCCLVKMKLQIVCCARKSSWSLILVQPRVQTQTAAGLKTRPETKINGLLGYAGLALDRLTTPELEK